MMEPDDTLDTTGLTCPLPVLRLKQALRKLDSGQILHVIATDRGTEHDFAAFARQTGHELLETRREEGKFLFWFKKR